MGVPVVNISVFNITPVEIDGKQIRQDDLRDVVLPEDFSGIPVIFKVGKAEYNLGIVHQARVGRDNVFIDTQFELVQELEYELTLGANDKPVFKPKRIVYKKE